MVQGNKAILIAEAPGIAPVEKCGHYPTPPRMVRLLQQPFEMAPGTTEPVMTGDLAATARIDEVVLLVGKLAEGSRAPETRLIDGEVHLAKSGYSSVLERVLDERSPAGHGHPGEHNENALTECF
ncbi:hypothetical protein ACVIGB_000862 [Bradyrhizobium sp. USDA 4341]